MRCRPVSTVCLALISTTPLAFGQGSPAPGLSNLARSLNYEDEVCQPVTEHTSDTVPPCLELVAIETVCTPNGTSSLALKAHQDCMCNGSFFSEWPFCLECLRIHGLRSQRDVAFYKSVLETASSALCGPPTPTAEFASVFSSAQGAVPYPTTGDTVSTDVAVGQTAVSLYYTATGPQGPGRITGEATAATAPSVLFTAPRATPPVVPTGSVASGSETGTASPSASGSGGAGTAKPTVGGSLAAARAGGGGAGLLAAVAVAIAAVVS